jgi:hypothetical protein
MRYFHILLLLLIATPLAAQDYPGDTLTVLEQKKLSAKKDPMGALLRSLAVPGWGQFYNDRYIKAGVVFVAESYFIYKAAYWWNETEQQYDLIQSLPQGQQPAAFNQYLEHRNRRNDFLWLTALAVFVSMFDAYVDAHLSGFEVDLTPDFEDGETEVKLTVTILLE